MKALNPVFAGAGTTIFTIMSALANQHGAINLGQGFPDVDGPLALRECAAKALLDGPNQYPPMMGVEVLRQALSAHAKRHYDLNYDWRSEVVVTSGATEALTASIMGLVNAGDEVILIEPAYDSYRPIVETIGAVAKPIRIGPPHWSISEQQLAAAFSPKTKAIVLNSPMNPAGKVFSRDELNLIASFARKFDALVISDEVYEHLTFDGLEHVPLATLDGMFERTVRIGSAGKMFSLTGWKVGWVEGPGALIGAVAKAHQFLTFTTAPALQIAVADGLNNHARFYLDLAYELAGNRDYLAKSLRAIGFEPLPAQGTYFLTTDIAKLRFNGSDVDFCKYMTEHARVAAIPLSVFYTGEQPQTLVRFAFCKRREVLTESGRPSCKPFSAQLTTWCFMDESRIPILIGAGQLTQRTAQKGKLDESLDPMQLLVDASAKAAADTGVADKIFAKLDTIAVVRFTADSSEAGRLPIGQYKNAPRTLGNRVGAMAKREYYTAAGGNTPQWLVNRIADEIARGEVSLALLAGSEDLATMIGALNKGQKLDWGDDPGGEPIHIGEHKAGVNDLERRHALYFPVNAYPLFENGIRGHKGRNVRDHQLALGQLFAPFSKVAATNPYAWFPKARTPEEIATPADDNRYVGFPYTKYMNAIIQVDQAAAVIMTNVKTARELGVHAAKWVYLHGGADASDIWNMSERVNYHSSPAIRTIGQKALDQADRTINDIDYFDLYSCFPSAVQIACAELGLAEDDPRGLTVTGGLPYFGGAGNNYVMHSIVTMMGKVRAKPGTFGLVTANGWYVTKHAMGIYSTLPPRNPWQREEPKSYQAALDAMAHPAVDAAPNGEGKVETYTVMHDRTGPKMGIIIGRLGNGHRFVAHTANDPQTLNGLMERDMLGRPGRVTAGEKTNLFVPA